MAVYYTTADKVISKLRLYDPNTDDRLADSTTTDPTTSEIETWITEAEYYIDKATGHAFTTRTVTDEYHDVNIDFNDTYPYEIAIPLGKRKVRDIDTTSDKIEIWDGSSWTDLASSGYTEGRNNDYYFDYEDGILYLCDERPNRIDNGVKVTYRFGEDSVPGDIQDAATKYAALNILEADFYKGTIPQTPENLEMFRMISERWRKDIERILNRWSEMIVV